MERSLWEPNLSTEWFCRATDSTDPKPRIARTSNQLSDAVADMESRVRRGTHVATDRRDGKSRAKEEVVVLSLGGVFLSLDYPPL